MKHRVPCGQWNELRVKWEGNLITVFLNGQQLFEVEDDLFGDAGKVGLWTKSDTVTYFPTLTISGLAESDAWPTQSRHARRCSDPSAVFIDRGDGCNSGCSSRRGIVTDPQDARVPASKISPVSRGFARQAQTIADGSCRFGSFGWGGGFQ